MRKEKTVIVLAFCAVALARLVYSAATEFTADDWHRLAAAIPFVIFVLGFLAAGCALIVAIGRAAHAGDEQMHKVLEDSND